MCNHRVPTFWWRAWATFWATALSVFAGLEICGLITEGPDATCTVFLRRVLGQLEHCRHTTAGRIGIVAVSAWIAAHLGYGRCGLDATSWCPVRRHQHVP